MPEASFVIHDRATTDELTPGRQMLHTHLFCAGSVPTLAGRECPMVKERDVVRNKAGLDRETNLNRIAEQNWAGILDRKIGLEWRVGRDLERHLMNGEIAGQAIDIALNGTQVEPTLASENLVLPAPEPASPSFDIGFF
jgi:hypothetical protein